MYSLLGEYFDPDEMGRMQRMEYNRRQLVSNGRDVLEASIKALKESKNKSTNGDDWLLELARRKEQLKSKKR